MPSSNDVQERTTDLANAIATLQAEIVEACGPRTKCIS
jgi:hypothetical protein